MTAPGKQLDKPEPRWQALLALLLVGGIYAALPQSLVRYERFRGAGHGVGQDQLDRYCALLREFMTHPA